MRIDSNVMNVKNQSTSNQMAKERPQVQREIKPPKTEISTDFIQEPFKDLSQKLKSELSMDEKYWIDVVERANKAIVGATCSFEYSIHERTKEIMVKVIDRDTKEIIRELPPEKILDMVATMWEMAGIIVDERR